MLGAHATFQCYTAPQQFTCLGLRRLIVRTLFYISCNFKTPRDHTYLGLNNNNNNNNNN